jgi:long-chain acyl-CoA synthetase
MDEKRAPVEQSALARAANGARPPLEPSVVLAGKRLVVVGGTGFLGKVWLSMLLARFPGIGHLHLLVRPKGEQTAEERFWAEIAPSAVFDPLRQLHPGAAFEAWLREKVTPIAGDIVEPLLGLGETLVAELAGKVAAVVNVAGVVDFNPPLDEALEVNAFGVNNLIELARALGAPVMHTSTCYVAGYRTGVIAEVDPREVPFPRAEGAPGERFIAPPEGIPVERKLDRGHWDPQNEIAECLDLIRGVRHRCEDAFRQSTFLDEAKHNLERRGEPCRGRALEDELARVKRRFIESKLVEAGTERALYWGWPNIYTYTKSIGEQALAASGLPFAIVRPAVVESAVEYPFATWNEGINTSAPFVYMALKGQVQFPVDRDVHLDLIPVDMVTSGMIAALAELIDGTARPVYQLGATDTNACKVSRYIELIGLYKRRKLQDGGEAGNRVVNAILARLEPVSLGKRRYRAHGPHALARAARGMASLLDFASFGPAASLFGPAAQAVRRAADREDKLGDVMDMFLPFVAECDWVFSCDNVRDALARMPADERARFTWWPEAIDWRRYMFEVHIPGIERWAGPLFEEKLRKELAPLRRYETLLDLLDEMAERHGHAVALRHLEPEGLTRTTFLEWRAASARVAGRLAASGVRPGDRVLLGGDNRPAWPIAYFGILRAGAVAVPVDAKLSASELGNVARSAGARLAILGAEVARVARSDAEALTVLDLDRAADDAGAPAPPDVQVASQDLASIIYTSGTTGEPKGVMLSHGNFAALLAAITPLFFLQPTDGVLSVLPLHHTFEFGCGLLLPMSRGACVSYLGEVTSERLGEGLRKARVTAMVGVPALWQLLERRLLREIRDKGPVAALAFDWALALSRMLGDKLGVDAGRLFFAPVHDKLGGRVKYLISGGSALPRSTADTFAALGLPLSEGYGLTEAAPVLTVSKTARTGGVGKPIPGVEVRIADADEHGVGEVLARGPNVMLGYFGDAPATARAVDADGWLHTGDLGKLDARGELVIVGRSKDVIVPATGENVYPDDVENALGDVEGVRELAVVGLRRGESEVVGLLAVPEPDDDRARAHRRAHDALAKALGGLSRHARPAVVQLWEGELPRTATRKVKRDEARRILERLAAASAPPPPDVAAAGSLALVRHAVAALVQREASQVRPEMSLGGDLGLDSLAAMELTVALEAQVGRGLDPERLAAVQTVRDLADVLDASGARAAVERLSEPIASDDAAAPVALPPPVARAAKELLGKAQMGFYERVMQPEIYGRAFIPHNRNAIVVSNHASHLDMGFVKYALGSYGRDIVSLAAQDYFFEGRWRRAYFEQLTNLQPFDRKTNLRQALRGASELLAAGKTVLIFPEGTRSPDGAIHEFKSTVGHLALSCRVDILPVHLGGTYEAMPKSRWLPTRRRITARIGPPLRFADLERLTAGLKLAASSRAIAALARQAVLALGRGGVLDLAEHASLAEALGERAEHPLVGLFRELEQKYVVGKVERPLTFYFSLGSEAEAKWTARLSPTGCRIEIGKPDDGPADCVLKTSADLFTRMIREAHMPTPLEIMTGMVKSNDPSLLATFQEAFAIR